jgi:hypothetical protein
MAPVVEASIRGVGPLFYHIDGEPGAGGSELRITTRPEALYVKAPRPESA